MGSDSNAEGMAGNMTIDPEVAGRFEKIIRLELHTIAALDIEGLRNALDKPVVSTLAAKGISNSMIALASAAMSLALASKDVNREGVQKLLDAADVEYDLAASVVMTTIDILHVKNNRIYVFAFYYLMFLGKEPTTEAVLEIVKAMDTEILDASGAAYIIKFCKEYANNPYDLMTIEVKHGGALKFIYEHFHSVIIDFSNTMADFTINEIAKTIQNEQIKNYKGEEFYPYIFTVSTLALAGREIHKGNVRRLLESAVITPKESILDVVASMHFRNQFIYLIGLYYLVAVGREPDMEHLVKVVRALDVQPDALVARQAIAYYNAKKLVEPPKG